jgi:putative IMPACT (imprinted ancient) family translation regulator
MNNQIGFNFWHNDDSIKKDFIIFKEIIIDRKSKYSSSWGKIKSEEDIKIFLTMLKKDIYFQKADHNSFAYRFVWENNILIEGKNDDGENWAGMCILRELQREDMKNIIIVITRYFWWIYLQNDRYKNVIEATKIFIEKCRK